MATDDLLPKKKTSSSAKAPAKGGGKKASPQMLRLMRVARIVGILLGGFVTLVGMMAVVGFVTDNFWARFIVGFLVVVGLPAFVSDRFLKRTNLGGGLSMVADVFAIILLAIALVLVAVDAVSKPILVREGDRYARSGSRGMARAVYFLGGVSPTFPEDKPAPVGSTSPPASGAPR